MALLGFGVFGSFFYIAVLITNAIAILSEDRFLARIGWSTQSAEPGFGQQKDDSIKARIITLIASVRTLMRIPLIVTNVLIIIYELLLG